MKWLNIRIDDNNETSLSGEGKLTKKEIDHVCWILSQMTPVETKGLMKCRHPYSKCRFMIGMIKKYRKPVGERECGVAEPDTVCKPLKFITSLTHDDSITKSHKTPDYKSGA